MQLRDSGLADVASVIVARTIRRCSGVQLDRVDFSLPAEVEPDKRYTIAAEVRRAEQLAAGDLLSVASHPWRAGDPPPSIEVKRVS